MLGRITVLQRSGGGAEVQTLLPPGPAPYWPRPWLSVQSRLPLTPRPSPRPTPPRPRLLHGRARAVACKAGSRARGTVLGFCGSTRVFGTPPGPRSATPEVQGLSRTLKPLHPLVPRLVSPGSTVRHHRSPPWPFRPRSK